MKSIRSNSKLNFSPNVLHKILFFKELIKIRHGTFENVSARPMDIL